MGGARDEEEASLGEKLTGNNKAPRELGYAPDAREWPEVHLRDGYALFRPSVL